MKYWLFKSEPSVWSWDDQVKAGTRGTHWNGVRNHLAKQQMMAMQVGDLGFFYHSNEGKEIVGMVDVRALRPLPRPVTLAAVKATPASPALGVPSPANGATLRQGEGEKWLFAWMPVPKAVEYELTVSGPTATKPMIKIKTAKTSYEYTCGSGRIMGHNKKGWTWTVRAKDAQGNWGEWTEKSTFDVE